MTHLTTSSPADQEASRIRALHSYKILDSSPEKEYDDIAKLAANLCNAPIALITFVDKKRTWYKSVCSEFSLPHREVPREISFCRFTIKNDHLFEVPDSLKNEHFKTNPIVTRQNIRFYAGYPLTDAGENKLGSLCIVDKKPRRLKDHECEALKTLANQIVINLEFRKAQILNDHKRNRLVESRAFIRIIGDIISLNLKSPLQTIESLYELSLLDKDNRDRYLRKINHNIKRLGRVSNGLLAFTRNDLRSFQKEEVHIRHLVKRTVMLFNVKNVKFEIPDNLPIIKTEYLLLEMVFQHLISNAIKFSKKSGTVIRIGCCGVKSYTFSISDNGIGIPQKYLNRLFKPFTHLVNGRRSGTGNGLFIVKKILDQRDSSIWVESEVSKGTTVFFEWSP